MADQPFRFTADTRGRLHSELARQTDDADAITRFVDSAEELISAWTPREPNAPTLMFAAKLAAQLGTTRAFIKRQQLDADDYARIHERLLMAVTYVRTGSRFEPPPADDPVAALLAQIDELKAACDEITATVEQQPTRRSDERQELVSALMALYTQIDRNPSCARQGPFHRLLNIMLASAGIGTVSAKMIANGLYPDSDRADVDNTLSDAGFTGAAKPPT